MPSIPRRCPALSHFQKGNVCLLLQRPEVEDLTHPLIAGLLSLVTFAPLPSSPLQLLPSAHLKYTWGCTSLTSAPHSGAFPADSPASLAITKLFPLQGSSSLHLSGYSGPQASNPGHLWFGQLIPTPVSSSLLASKMQAWVWESGKPGLSPFCMFVSCGGRPSLSNHPLPDLEHNTPPIVG